MKTIERATSPYIRENVEKDTENMYIFTDNTDRDSGRGTISSDSWYAKKYGEGKHYPKMTSAVIRGLENAYPITTQRYYNDKYKGENGRWTDDDLSVFFEVIMDDFAEILKNSHKYKKIIFPMGGIFDSKIANISKERVPKLHKLLSHLCKFLYYSK